jgi:hypothetical protein
MTHLCLTTHTSQVQKEDFSTPILLKPMALGSTKRLVPILHTTCCHQEAIVVVVLHVILILFIPRIENYLQIIIVQTNGHFYYYTYSNKCCKFY